MQSQVWFNIIGFHSLALSLPLAAFILYKRPHLLHHLMALFLGLLTAFVDQHGDDPQFTVLLLLTFGFFMGFSQPEKVWRWALLLSAWVPFTMILRIVLEGRHGEFVNEGLFSIVPLVPGFIGSYAGSLLHGAGSKAATQQRSST